MDISSKFKPINRNDGETMIDEMRYNMSTQGTPTSITKTEGNEVKEVLGVSAVAIAMGERTHTASEGKQKLDEMTEVAEEMIASYDEDEVKRI